MIVRVILPLPTFNVTVRLKAASSLWPTMALTTTEGSTVFNPPLTNEPYSNISGDFNPIHINAYLLCYASLPGTVTHGLWLSAATWKYLENIVAQGHPDRVLVLVSFHFYTCLF